MREIAKGFMVHKEYTVIEGDTKGKGSFRLGFLGDKYIGHVNGVICEIRVIDDDWADRLEEKKSLTVEEDWFMNHALRLAHHLPVTLNT